jgi:VanZ family protein
LKKFLHFHIPGILWIVFILILTVIPGSLIPQVPSYLDLFRPDKLVHLFLFGVLVFLLLHGIQKYPDGLQAHRFAVPIALNIGIFLGGITELFQGSALVSGRQCSVYDFIANVAGCFLGWGIFVLVCKMRKARN